MTEQSEQQIQAEKASIIREAFGMVMDDHAEFTERPDAELAEFTTSPLFSTLAGPIQDVICRRYEISNPSVKMPQYIQDLFMLTANALDAQLSESLDNEERIDKGLCDILNTAYGELSSSGS